MLDLTRGGRTEAFCSTCPKLSSERVASRTLQTSLAVLLGMFDADVPRCGLYDGPDGELPCECPRSTSSCTRWVEGTLRDLIISAA